MTIYLIKEDNSYETYNNVIEWSSDYVIYQAGKGKAKIYAGEGEYFTDVQPKIVEE